MIVENRASLLKVLSSYQNINKEETSHIHFIITGKSEFGGADYQITLTDFYLDIGGGTTSISTKNSLNSLESMKEVDLNDKNQLREALSLDPDKVVVNSWALGTFRDRDSGNTFPEITFVVENQKGLSVPSSITYRNIQNMDE